MKTSKRKRSPKSAPVVEALDVASAPAAAESAAPVVAVEVVAEPASEPVVEATKATEPVAAAVEGDALVAEAVTPDAVAPEAVEVGAGPNDETVAVEAVVANEPAQTDATPVDPVVVLAANCSVKDAAALKTSLCAVAEETSAVTLDASAVERVDTATMQLLCAFARDRNARKQSIVWRGQSQALKDAVRLLGVGALLGLDAQGAVA